jgi:hypothetical protein
MTGFKILIGDGHLNGMMRRVALDLQLVRP